jgi:hypothetical protein
MQEALNVINKTLQKLNRQIIIAHGFNFEPKVGWSYEECRLLVEHYPMHDLLLAIHITNELKGDFTEEYFKAVRDEYSDREVDVGLGLRKEI